MSVLICVNLVDLVGLPLFYVTCDLSIQPSQPQPTQCANRCWDSSDTVMMIQCGDDSSKKLGRIMLKAILSAGMMSAYHIYSKFGCFGFTQEKRRELGRDDINI